MVDLALDHAWSGEVGAFTVAGGFERVVEHCLGLRVGRAGCLDLGVALGERPGKSLHLAGEKVLWDGSGVVRLQQLLSLVLGVSLAPGRSLQPALCLCSVGREFSVHGGSDLLGVFGSDLELAVEPGDAFLDLLSTYAGARAVVGPHLRLDAHEVVVVHVVPAVAGKDHPSAAAGAVDRAAEIVLVHAVLLAGVIVCRQYVLNGQPGVGLDQHWVLSLVVDALVDDNSHVVGILQDVIHAVERDWLARALLGGATGQPFGLGGKRELDTGPLAGGVLLEAPADDLGSFVVQFDPGVPWTVTLVQVAQWRLERRTALLDLAAQALHHFQGEVAAVELGDLGQKAVEQTAAGCVVDVLRAGDELDAMLLQDEVDRDVVGPVARQAVDLVYDDVVGLDPLDVLEHLL